ncbi:hypothetical protein EMCRGX_G033719 [Ephydatia muelleri]
MTGGLLPVLLVCDNPRASELLNHLGSAAIKFCRICMITEIRAQLTESESGTKKSCWIREDDNPLLSMPADLYECTPVEALHTLLLGT